MSQIIHNQAFLNSKFNFDSINEIIDYIIEKNIVDTSILVVPTGKLQNRLRFQFMRQYYEFYKKPINSKPIQTLSSFITSCFCNTFKFDKYKNISDAYRRAITEEAINNSDLSYFKSKDTSTPYYIIEKLDKILYGLREDGIELNTLIDERNQLLLNDETHNEATKLDDIIKLYQSYQDLLANDLLDFPELLRKLNTHYSKVDIDVTAFETLFAEYENKKSSNNIDGIFSDTKLIILYGFSEFKNPEIKFLSHFVDSEIPLAIHIDYSLSNGPLFGNFDENFQNLLKAGFKNYIVEDNTEKQSSYKYHLRRYLFNKEEDVKSNDLSSFIKVIATASKYEEVDSMAKLIKYLIIKKEYQPKDICIVSRQSENYSDLIREVFISAQIPINITDRFALSKSPITVAFFSLFDIVLRGYQLEDLVRALYNPFISFNDSSVLNNSIDITNFISTAKRLRIIGGLKRGAEKFWLLRLEAAINSLENRLKYSNFDNNTDKIELNQLSKEIESIKKAYIDFKIISNMINFKNINLSPSEFATLAKEKVLKKFNIKENIIKNSFIAYENNYDNIIKKESIERNSRAFSELISIIDETTYILNDRFPNKKFKLEYYIDRLKTAVTGAKYQIKEKQDYGVTITSIEQTRGIGYNVLILCGAIDKEFPLSYHAESFLGRELPDTEQRHIRSERMQFYQFLSNESIKNNPNKLFYIFYPKYNGIEENVPSSFLDSLYAISSLKQDNCILDLESIKSKNDLLINENNYPEWLDIIININQLYENYKNIDINLLPENIKDYIINKIEYFNSNSFNDTIDGKIDISYFNVFDNISILNNNKSYSVTEFEKYAKCPYFYFIENIIRISNIEIEDIALSPLEKGNLLHRILYLFYKTLQNESNQDTIIQNNNFKIIPIKLDINKAEIYQKLLFNIAKTEINNIRYIHPFFELEEEELFGNQIKKGILEIWLNLELSSINKRQYLPALFEFGFGFKNNSPNKQTIENIQINENIKLNGKIDRIEINTNDNEFHYLIADYKSSKASIPNNNKIKNGISFQLPLYIAAAQIFLKNTFNIDATPDGGIYYNLKPELNKDKTLYNNEFYTLTTKDSYIGKAKDAKLISRWIENLDELESIIKDSINYANNIVININNGIFTPTPSLNSCNYCNYSSICRKDSNN